MLQDTSVYGLPFLVTATGLAYTGPAMAVGIVVSSHTNGTVKLWDALSATGTVLVDTFTFPTGSGSYSFHGAKALTGIFVTVGGTVSATLVFNPYRG